VEFSRVETSSGEEKVSEDRCRFWGGREMQADAMVAGGVDKSDWRGHGGVDNGDVDNGDVDNGDVDNGDVEVAERSS
jgi:hypothetical protein